MGLTRLGKNHKLYRNTGSFGAPIWSEMPDVRDLMLDQSKGEADASRRGSGGDEAKVGTLKTRSLDFDILVRQGNAVNDADLAALSDSYENGTALDFLVLNGPVSTPGNKGLRMPGEVFKYSNDQKLTEVSKYAVTVKVTDGDNPPAPYTS